MMHDMTLRHLLHRVDECPKGRYATDLMKALGYNKSFALHAKDYTHFSYKGEEVI